MDIQDPALARLIEQVDYSREHHVPVDIRGGDGRRDDEDAP